MMIPSPYQAQLAHIPVRRRELPVDGARTVFWEYGDAHAAVTIVLVHGFRGDHHGLEPVVAQLPGVRFLAPDLPGFGESEPFPDRPHNIQAYASWLRGFLTQVGSQDPRGRTGEPADASATARRRTPVVLGHSFGSIVVAAALAVADPLADRIILVNPIAAPALSGPRGVLTRLAVFYYWLGRRLPERIGYALLRNRLIVRVMSVAMAKTRERDLRRWIHDQHDRYFSAFANRQVVLEAFRASVGHDVSEFASHISTDTLLVAAERDDITPVAAQHRLVARFPHASLVVIPEVGHLIHYETPAAAADAIRDYLAVHHTDDRTAGGAR